MARLLAPIYGEFAKRIARDLITEHRSLHGVLWADDELLAACIGDDCAVEYLTAFREVHVFLNCEHLAGRDPISNLPALHTYLNSAMAHERAEQVRVLFLNTRNVLLRDEVVTNGCLDEAPLYARQIMRRALQVGAGAIIIVHNHPSGDPTPSKADIACTRRLIEAGRTLGVRVHDHLIVANGGIVSLRSEGHI